jgi:tetratricopeptide (TPR) repeat protein
MAVPLLHPDPDGGRAPLVTTAALLLAPLAILWPWPRALSAHDPEPALAAAGLATLGTGALVLLLSRRLQRLTGRARRLLLPFLAIVLATVFGQGSEPLATAAQLCTLAAAGAAFLVGATLDRAERHTLVQGYALVGLLASWPALIEAALGSGTGLEGVLLNSGPTSQAALPGALAGLWLTTCRRGPWRLIGAAALVGFALHALLAPVLAGALALALATTAVALLSPWCQELRPMRASFGGAAAAAVFLGFAAGLPRTVPMVSAPMVSAPMVSAPAAERPESGLTLLPPPPDAGAATAGDTAAQESPPQEAAEPVANATPGPASVSHLGGFGVRWSVWTALPPMVAAAGPFGFGPGRFRAEFPPYRDPREVAASEYHGLRAGLTEVEHAHNDWLQGLVDFGWLGGAAWLLFLGLGVQASAQALRQRAFGRAVCGTIGLALLGNALWHSALLANPAAAVQGFAALGVVTATGTASPLSRLAARGLGLLPVVLLLFAPLAPWVLVQQGRALGRHLERTVALAAAERDAAPAALRQELATERGAALQRALDLTHGAHPAALELALVEARRSGADAAHGAHTAALGAYTAALVQLRPHSTGTWVQVALSAAAGGQLDLARDRFAAAVQRHPHAVDLNFDLARATLELGRGAEALELARVAVERGTLDETRRLALVRDAQLLGWCAPDLVRALHGLPGAPTAPAELFERAELLRASQGTTPTVAALESLAHHSWAREHAERGDFATAVRSYRQAWRAAEDGASPASPLLRLELAAAERLAGHGERAAALLTTDAAAGPAVRDSRAQLPPWAAAALEQGAAGQ